MQAPWIISSTFLPDSGASIDFMLEDRGQPIHGTFADGAFHSRWADYGTDRVQSWRGSDPDGATLPTALPAGTADGSFVAMLRRLASTLSLRRAGFPDASARRRRKTPALPAIDVPPRAAMGRGDYARIAS